MKILEAGRDPREAIYEAICPQETEADETLRQKVSEIMADVRERGDEAVIDYGRRFDYPLLERLAVTEAEVDSAYESTEPELIESIRRAARLESLYLHCPHHSQLTTYASKAASQNTLLP